MIAALVVGGMVAVAAPIGDNSMFVHLRTGIDMVTHWSIPRTDPYSFTAAGHRWIVQSWLAEGIYGLLSKYGDDRLVILLHIFLSGAAAFVIALLARAGSMARTLFAGALPIALAWLSWTQRPLLFGVLAFALLIFVTTRRRSAWWLLPVAWVWVNTHGSWPTGIAWLAAFAIGERMDRGVFDKRTLKYAAYFGGGILLGAINPLGPRILIFFASAFGDRAKSFAAIVEWGSPSFHSASGAILALILMLVVAIGFRSIVPWRHLIPVLGLLFASLYANRNLSMLAVAIAPLLGHVLKIERSTGKQPQTPSASHDARVVIYVLGLVAFVGLSVVGRTVAQNPYELKMYPVAALNRMSEEGLLDPNHNVLGRETTGCFRIWRVGKEARVFIDDRIDMYPASVSADYLHLYGTNKEVQPILDKYRIDVVLWESDKSLSQLLAVDPRWKTQFKEGDWTVFVRA